MLRAIISLLLMLLIPMTADAQINPADLDKLKREQAAAKAKADKIAKQQDSVRADINKFKRDLQKSAAQSATIEKTSRQIADKLSELNRDETRLNGSLSADKAALTEVLAALQRLEVNPPPALMVGAKNASDAAMAAVLMGSVSDQLNARATELRARITELSAVRDDIEAEKAKLSRNEAVLNQKRTEIKSLVAEKSKLDAKLGETRAAEKRRAERLAAQADDLQELIRRFELTARAIQPRIKPSRDGSGATPRVKPRSGSRTETPIELPDGTVRFADARGALTSPVQGTLKSSYGNGRQGMTIATRPGAQVLSPYTGRVEFAGAFKTYGEVVILNVGENYFILLTGLGEIFVSAGETVDLGEPVGLMPFNAQKGTELYIEFRKSGQPINPKPWLGASF
ncbi:murein hydrolase activator EnvC [Fretibacter rubidus]|uniref:murein hydrolase activator EnvC family protein n=1 Tax=Fretibacter rubidus TaxID=570162 RepID=UPI003529F0E4